MTQWSVGRGRRAAMAAVAAALALALACAASGPTPAPAPRTTAAPAPATPTPSSAQLATPAELETLVAPVAFYSDPLLSLVLPASTQPVQIVQASRFLDARKANPSLQPDSAWDASVRSLLNYPEAVQKLNGDLGWTQRLGDAIYDQQEDVIDAVQSVRAKAYHAGTLRSDAKQVVTMKDGVVTIVPADTEVIYVPVYDTQTIYVQAPAAPVVVYSDPYPVYWGPAAVFASGVALGWALDWYHHDIWYGPGGWYGWHGGDVDIDRTVNINRPAPPAPPTSPSAPGRPPRPEPPPGGGAWRPDNRPSGPQRPATLPAGRPGAGGAGRPSQLPATPSAGRPGAGVPARASQLPSTRPGDRPISTLESGRFGDYKRGSDTLRESQRGAASRGSVGSGGYGGSRPSMSRPSAPSRGSFGGAGGGMRGGGGGARGGGGMRGGGGRR